MKITNAISNAVNVAVIVGLGIFLFGPTGVVSEEWRDWRESVIRRRQISSKWGALIEAGSRMDVGTAEPFLVEFSDYQCPSCGLAHRIMEPWLVANSAGVVYRHLPLTEIHPLAEGAARASICAEEQGLFREMHLRLFETDGWQKDGDWTREAQAIGIPDVDRYEECLESVKTTTRLESDAALAQELGIRGTPTFVHAGGLLSGVVSEEILSELYGKSR